MAGLKCSGVENHPRRFIDKPGVTVQLEVSRRRGTELLTTSPYTAFPTGPDNHPLLMDSKNGCSSISPGRLSVSTLEHPMRPVRLPPAWFLILTRGGPAAIVNPTFNDQDEQGTLGTCYGAASWESNQS